ncbi:hypothetical protein ABPG72_006328 [Tetrahymena utriculariae]
MGNSLCNLEHELETQQSINIARNYFNQIDSNLDRDATGKIHRIKESHIYKQKLVELIKSKNEKNQIDRERKQETYLIPFLEIAYSTNQLKYEQLVLNMKSAQKKMDEIIKQKEMKLKNVEDIDIRMKEQQELDDMLNKMALNEYFQVIAKKKKKQDSSLLQSQCNNNGLSQHLTNQQRNYDINSQIGCQNSLEKQFLSNNIDHLFHTRSSEIPKDQVNQQLQKSISADYQNHNTNSYYHTSYERPTFGKGSHFCQSQIQNDRIQYSILDINQEYQSGLIASNQYLLNYLYEKVSKDEHIVKSLIDKFGELIQDKFSPIFNQYENLDIFECNLTKSSVDCYEKISEIVKEDIIFLIEFIKQYLNEIYGEKIIPPNTMNKKQKENIFDLFVRKVVFDNEKICEIAFKAIDISSISQNNQLRSFKKQATKSLNIQNAFNQEEMNLKFLSKCCQNPFIELEKELESIKHLSSPYLKMVQIENFRTKIKLIVNNLYKELAKSQKNIQFSVDQMIHIETFIFITTNVELFNDLKFIQTYAKQNELGNGHADTWYDIHELILKQDNVESYLDFIFFNQNQKKSEIQQQQIQAIKEESESMSEYSKLSQQELAQLQFNNNNNNQKNQNQIAINYTHSASSHTITEYSLEQAKEDLNNNQIFSQSDIITTMCKKSEQQSLRDDNNTSKQSFEFNKQSFEFNKQSQFNNNIAQYHKSTFGEENQQMISTAVHGSILYDPEMVIEDENEDLDSKIRTKK